MAFGSLIGDPGDEIWPKITMRIKVMTPFGVEFGRYSHTRGGAPTLVPHQLGAPVAAEVLVVDDTVSIEEARNMLWRRETRKIGSGQTYREGTSANRVLVKSTFSPAVSEILYTDFADVGKIQYPTAAELAAQAIASVKIAENSKDGISYLIDAMNAGIQTPLTKDYCDEILRQTGCTSLQEAREKAESAGVANQSGSVL